MVNFKKKILIYRLGSLGDTVMALPCFHKVREVFADADIAVLTNQPVMAKAAPLEAILGSQYFFDHVVAYPVGTRNPFVLLRLILKIRSLKITTVVNLSAARSKQSAVRDKWFFKAAGVNELIGFPKIEEDFVPSIDPVTGMGEWEAKRLARRISVLGKISLDENKYWDLKLTEAENVAANEILGSALTGAPVIAISLGTKVQANNWGIDNWLLLLKRLILRLPRWKLVVTGAPNEFELAERCLIAWGKEGVNLCGKTSPRVSAGVLSKANVFIGHDSGPMHLAACMGTPCVAVFSARNPPGQWYPKGGSNKVIYHHTDCAGCKLEVCIEQQKKCILSITVGEVEQAVMEIVSTLKMQDEISFEKFE